MALDKQIIREYSTYANLIAPGNDNELQLYMIGIATDTDEFIFRSDDGYHRCLDSGTTALSEHSIPFIDSNGKVVQDNTNLQFNDGTNVLTTYELTTLNDINAAEYIKRSGVDDDYIRFENDKITIAAGGVTACTIEDTDITFANGVGINLYEDLTFLGGTGENIIAIPDSLADALSIKEGANSYLTFSTDSENITFGKDIEYIGTSTPTITFGSSDASDPTIILKTTNTSHEIQISIDENVIPDDLQIFGQTAGVDTYVSIQAVSGQDAVIYLKTISAGNCKIIHEANGDMHFINDEQDKDIVLEIDDGGVGKTITWDADVDQLKHSAGTFDFSDDIITTTGNITGAIINATGGFQDNGTPGIDDTFTNGDGDTVTVSGGIITSIVTP